MCRLRARIRSRQLLPRRRCTALPARTTLLGEPAIGRSNQPELGHPRVARRGPADGWRSSVLLLLAMKSEDSRGNPRVAIGSPDQLSVATCCGTQRCRVPLVAAGQVAGTRNGEVPNEGDCGDGRGCGNGGGEGGGGGRAGTRGQK